MVANFPTPKRVLEIYNPTKQDILLQHHEGKAIRNEKSPRIFELEEMFNDNGETALMLLEITLKDLSDFSTGDLAPEQIFSTAKIIKATYPYMRLSELLLFGLWYKQGKLTKEGVWISPAVVMGAMNTYHRLKHDVEYDYIQQTKIKEEDRVEMDFETFKKLRPEHAKNIERLINGNI